MKFCVIIAVLLLTACGGGQTPASSSSTAVSSSSDVISHSSSILPSSAVSVSSANSSVVSSVSSASALPQSYGFEHYTFPEPNDGAACTGTMNPSANLGDFQFAQTHLMSPDWPLFFLIADRPALLMVSVTGQGAAPEIKVEGVDASGDIFASLCLKGPEHLPTVIDTQKPSRAERYSATLPSHWLRRDHSLIITMNGQQTVMDASTLTLDRAVHTAYNQLVVDLDVLNYNDNRSLKTQPASYLANLASAIPASGVSVGRFPVVIPLSPIVVGHNGVNGKAPSRLEQRPCSSSVTTGCQSISDISGMDVAAAALRMLEAVKKATGDHVYSHYFGQIHHIGAGGWGGNKSFVSTDYSGVALHEGGHALSLPHWGQGAFQNTTPSDTEYRYPYGGENNDGGGRGESWSYIQSENTFVSPICELTNSRNFGLERSDGMQRNIQCDEWRDGQKGPWDGFGDFSAIAMHRDMAGAPSAYSGTVPYREAHVPFALKRAGGWPLLTRNESGQRVLSRDGQDDALALRDEEKYPFLRPMEWDVPVYTIYGSFHPDALDSSKNDSATVMYPPLRYSGNLPQLIDPTDADEFSRLQARQAYGQYFYWDKDLTFKLIYRDGTVKHALYPYGNVSRTWQYGSGPWRRDILYYAINIPADHMLSRVELYYRPFNVRGHMETRLGNINDAAQNIHASNFLASAVLVDSVDIP